MLWNSASEKRGGQSSSSLHLNFLQDAFFIKLLDTFLLLMLCTINKKCVTKFIIKLQRNGNEIFHANNQYYEISVVREAFLEMIMIGKLENRSCNI